MYEVILLGKPFFTDCTETAQYYEDLGCEVREVSPEDHEYIREVYGVADSMFA